MMAKLFVFLSGRNNEWHSPSGVATSATIVARVAKARLANDPLPFVSWPDHRKNEPMNHHQPIPEEEWIKALAAGDPEVEAEFWRTYTEPLHRIADRQLSRQLKRRVDPEDVVQSACRTFFRRVRQGEFSLRNHDELWRLLLTITLNKARMQARFHGRDRRGLNREQALGDEPAVNESSMEDAIAGIDFSDLLASIMRQLSAEQQRIFQGTLDGEPQEAIAAVMGCSERTVRRMQAGIREHLQNVLRASFLETE